MTKRLAHRLEECRICVQNAQNDLEIKTALTPFGYTDEKLQNGANLYQETLELFTVQGKEKQDVKEIVDQFIEARDEAEEAYEELCKLGRVAFRQSTALHPLLPSVISFSPFDVWKLNAHTMYDNMLKNDQALALLGNMGVTGENLQLQIDKLDALEQLQNQRNIEEGEAQQATKNRNAKLEQLKDYCRDLKEIAKVAFKDKPQLLEKLGILVRS